MDDYLVKKKELDVIAKIEANKIANELISKSAGDSVLNLRKSTLDFIRQNQIPEDISLRVKEIINQFISNIKIPVQ